MKNILITLFSFLYVAVYAQEKFDAENFLNSALENYATAQSMEIEVTVNLYEKGSEEKQNTFVCVSKKNGEKTYLKIRNTDLITTDSIRLFVDHNNQYMQLQKVTNKKNTPIDNPANFVDQLRSNSKEFINASKVEHKDLLTVFTNKQKDMNFSTSYYFNNKTKLLEKIVNHYASAEAPYEKIEMIYTTNLNENNGPIIISVEDYLAIRNSKMTLTETYKDYEFINQSKDE